MTTRYKAGDPSGIPSGYSSEDVPSDLQVPGCGIVDVDRAINKLFEQDIKFTVKDSKNAKLVKVPVIFATGERWALLKKERPFRDNNQTIILPLITIKRLFVEQNNQTDINGRGINQQTGELVVKRRLSSRDRTYQNLISKLNLKNQSNISNTLGDGLIDTDREVGINENDLVVRDGGLLVQNFDKNIWEIITIPMPQFYNMTYEIVFWTQYTTHMNEMIQQLMASYLMQGGSCLKIETTQGYWFVASVENNRYDPQDNSDEYGEDERIIKYTFNMNVPAYFIVGENTVGTPAATRRYVSSPFITFDIGSDEQELLVNGSGDETSKLDNSDDPTDSEFLLNDKPDSYAKKNTSNESTYSSKLVYNPFMRKKQIKYSKVVTTNPATGETVYRDIDGINFKILNK